MFPKVNSIINHKIINYKLTSNNQNINSYKFIDNVIKFDTIKTRKNVDI